ASVEDSPPKSVVRRWGSWSSRLSSLSCLCNKDMKDMLKFHSDLWRYHTLSRIGKHGPLKRDLHVQTSRLLLWGFTEIQHQRSILQTVTHSNTRTAGNSTGELAFT